MHSSHWPAARLVNKQFDASLAPLIKTITIRQWHRSSHSSSSSKMSVSSSSSLKQARQLNAVVDNEGHLQQLLQLLAQLPQVQQLRLRGLKPLSGLSQLLLGPASGSDWPCELGRSVTAAAAVDALARVTQLDLPDSSSSSLPQDLQLPGLILMRLFSVDSFEHLAGFAPQLQDLRCCTVALAPPAQLQHTASTAGNSSNSAALNSCRRLAAPFVTSNSAKTAVACLASALPALVALVTLPQLQHTGPPDPQQQCDEITLKDLQAALPGLQLVAQADARPAAAV
jgi:hypothetical protein